LSGLVEFNAPRPRYFYYDGFKIDIMKDPLQSNSFGDGWPDIVGFPPRSWADPKPPIPEAFETVILVDFVEYSCKPPADWNGFDWYCKSCHGTCLKPGWSWTAGRSGVREVGGVSLRTITYGSLVKRDAEGKIEETWHWPRPVIREWVKGEPVEHTIFELQPRPVLFPTISSRPPTFMDIAWQTSENEWEYDYFRTFFWTTGEQPGFGHIAGKDPTVSLVLYRGRTWIERVTGVMWIKWWPWDHIARGVQPIQWASHDPKVEVGQGKWVKYQYPHRWWAGHTCCPSGWRSPDEPQGFVISQSESEFAFWVKDDGGSAWCFLGVGMEAEPAWYEMVNYKVWPEEVPELDFWVPEMDLGSANLRPPSENASTTPGVLSPAADSKSGNKAASESVYDDCHSESDRFFDAVDAGAT
jgi:hypothetical protein